MSVKSFKRMNENIKIEDISEDISIEEFDALQGQHKFSKEYQANKQEMLDALKKLHCTNRCYRKYYRAAAVVALLCVALPTTVFAVNKLYQVTVTKNKHQANIEIKKHTEAQKDSTESHKDSDKKAYELTQGKGGAVYAPLMQLQLSYLPDGCSPSAMDIYKYWGGREGEELGLSFNRYDISQDEDFLKSVKDIQNTEQFVVNGHEVILLEKAETYAYDKEVYVVFEKQKTVIHIYAGYGIGKEELKKLIAGMSVKKTKDAEKAVPLMTTDAFNEELSNEEIDTNNHKKDSFINIGDTIKDEINKDVNITVKDVQIKDDIKLLDSKYADKEYITPFVDADGKMKAYKRTKVNHGDGVNEISSFGEAKEVKKKLLYLTVVLKNTGSEKVTHNIGNVLDFMKKESDKTYSDVYWDSYVISNTPQKMANHNEPVYFDQSDYDAQSKSFYQISMKPGEEIVCHIGYLVDEDLVDYAYLQLLNSDGSKSSYVKLKE